MALNAIAIREVFDSRELVDYSNIQFIYDVFEEFVDGGTPLTIAQFNEKKAANLAYTTAPDYYQTPADESETYDPNAKYGMRLRKGWPVTVENKGHRWYRATVPYNTMFNMSFDTRGGHRLVQIGDYVEYAWVEKRGAEGQLERLVASEAPNGFLVINPEDDGTAKGVEIPAARFAWTEVWNKNIKWITQEHLEAISNMTVTVNNQKFRGFDAGEILFLGASGEPLGDVWKISYEFERQPNERPFTRFDGAINADDMTKRGWWHENVEFKWVPEEQTNETFSTLHRELKSLALVRIFKESNFDNLAIASAIPLGSFQLPSEEEQQPVV